MLFRSKILKKPQSGTGPGYIFVINEEQRKQVAEVLGNQIEAKIDIEEKARAEFASQAPREYKGPAAAKISGENLAQDLANLYYGDEELANSAAKSIQGRNTNITNLVKDKDDKGTYISFTYTNDKGETSSKKEYINNLKQAKSFVNAYYNEFATKEEQEFKDQSVNSNKYDKTRTFSSTKAEAKRQLGGGATEATPPQQRYVMMIQNSFPKKLYVNQGKAKDQIVSLVGGIPGFSVQATGDLPGSEYLTITPPGGEGFEFNLKDKNAANNIKSFLSKVVLDTKAIEAIGASGALVDYGNK